MRRHKIVVLLLEQVLPLDFAIPMHVFAREAPEFYEVRTATVDGLPVGVAGEMSVIPDGGLDSIREAETIIVPGYGDASQTKLDQMTLAMLRAAGKRRARIVSICSGAFALAQAGLLTGLRVATHWSLADELARQYPDLIVDGAAMYVDSGYILTSGGVTAGVDLCLHILRRDLGGPISNHVARRIVAAPRRDVGQAQFAETTPVPPGDDVFAETQQWMLSNLERPITVAAMADHAHLSERHFHRQFVNRAHLTPISWLLNQRIQRAKELLETTNMPIDEIAGRVGLGSAANLRIHFRRATNTSPMRYRLAFSTLSEKITNPDCGNTVG